MHILLIHQGFASPSEAGGTRHFEFAKHCVANGHQFSIVTSSVTYLDGKKMADGLVTSQNIGGVRIWRAKCYSGHHRGFIWRLLSFFSFMLSSFWASLLVKNVDLVMGTSPSLFQGFTAWLVAAIKRRPFLLEIRDLWPDFAIEMGVLKNPILIWLAKRLERFLYWRADHILVNSPAYRDVLIQKKGLSPTKVSLIANGVDLSMFQPQKSTGGERFSIMYAGALGPANDIDTILRTADLLKDRHEFHFVFVGDGKERSRLEMTATQLGLSNVQFVGSVPKEQMPNVLSSADVCVATLRDIPMFKTTYPNKVFDYMAAQKPVILAIDGAIRQVVEDAGAGIFVPPSNEHKLAEAILLMEKDREATCRMGEKGRTYVEQHFNRQKQATDFLNLAEQIA